MNVLNQMRTSQPRRTVLVVEDEWLMRRLLQRILSRQDISVLLAADGEKALEIYRHHKEEINVVLLDLGLPKISGWEVFNNLKQENPDLCIVVASGYMEPEVKGRMHEAGVEHFIEKPYRLDRLVQTLYRVMEHG